MIPRLIKPITTLHSCAKPAGLFSRFYAFSPETETGTSRILNIWRLVIY